MKLIELFESNDDEHNTQLQKTGFWGKAGAGVIFLALDTGRFLIGKRGSQAEQPNTWGSWGGAIDRGETPEQAARRETSEEAGYNGHYELIPLYVFSDPKGSGFKFYNFLALVDEEFKPTLSGEAWENTGYKWVEYGDWPTPLHFGLSALFNDPKSIEKIKNELNEINGTEAEPEKPKEPDTKKLSNDMADIFAMFNKNRKQKTESITEGVNDPAIFKAIFTSGGPGSGKTTISRKIIGDLGFVKLNIDDAIETLAKQKGIDLKSTDNSDEYDDLYRKSIKITTSRKDLAIQGRLGLVIDSTGADYNWIEKTKHELESLGYDTLMIFVNTPLELALDRNERRERVEPENVVRDRWQGSHNNIGKFQHLFGTGNFLIFDNQSSDPEELSTNNPRLIKLYKNIKDWVNQPIHNYVAKKWIKNPVAEASVKKKDESQYLEETSNIIIRDCIPWLKEIKTSNSAEEFFTKSQSMLIGYRGMNRNNEKINPILFKSNVETDREPVNTDIDFNIEFNKALSELGFIATRKNSIFVTGNPGVASHYGDVFSVFPIGNYNYTWSEEIHDFAQHLHSNFDTFREEKYNTHPAITGMKKFIKKLFFIQNKDLKRALRSESEIYINCKQYYAVPHQYTNDLMKLIKSKLS